MEKFKEYEKRIKNLIDDYLYIMEQPTTKEDRIKILEAKIEALRWSLRQAQTLLTSWEK